MSERKNARYALVDSGIVVGGIVVQASHAPSIRLERIGNLKIIHTDQEFQTGDTVLYGDNNGTFEKPKFAKVRGRHKHKPEEDE